MAAGRLTPYEIKAVQMLAYCFYQLGRYESCRRALKALRALGDDGAPVRRLEAAACFKLNLWQETLDLTAAEDGSTPESAQLLKLRARALYKMGKEAEAMRLTQQISAAELDHGSH